MILLFIGIVLSISLLIYFYICNLKASVFPRMGFVNDEIPIGKITLKKYYSFDCLGDKKDEEE